MLMETWPANGLLTEHRIRRLFPDYHPGERNPMLRIARFVVLASMLAASTAALAQTPLGTAFTYQGRLNNAGTPASGLHDLEFRLFDTASAGTQVGPTVCLDNVPVVGGLFTVQVDFGGQYMGAGRWLQIGVRADPDGSIACGSGTFTSLSGRQPLTTTPYALALPGLWTQNNATSPNVIGGFTGNSVAPSVLGAVVAGGGLADYPNVVNGGYGVVSGGASNTVSGVASTVGGGYFNTVTGSYSTVGGGQGNTTSAWNSTLGGGYFNTASGAASTVAGGQNNSARGLFSTVAGGVGNTADGSYSTVGGGLANSAGGDFSFAAGNRAKVRTAAQTGDSTGDEGTFVWADSQNADFASTGPNQFLIRAAGGVGIGTASPTKSLEVANNTDCEIGIRSMTTNGRLWTLQSSSGTADGQLASSFQIIDRTVGSSRILIDAAGRVGVGTTFPDQVLTVGGNASKPGGGSWAAYSDPRLKHDIQPMSGTLDKLLSLHGYSFEYNADAVASGRGLPGRQMGLMADEVERVFPDWVSRNDEGYRSVTERATTALMVESLRDLRQEKDEQIATLKRENQQLAERLARLEALMEKANAK